MKPTFSKVQPPVRIAKGIHPGMVVLGFFVAIAVLLLVYYASKPKKAKESLASMEIRATQHGAASDLALKETVAPRDTPIIV
jgi:hypothetical protein